MDSAIGLSTMLAMVLIISSAIVGGFHQMDEHFRTVPIRAQPAPYSWAFLVSGTPIPGSRNRCGIAVRAILSRFPAYPQQLTMESNGKHVTLSGGRSRLYKRAQFTGVSRGPPVHFFLSAHSPRHPAHPLRLIAVLLPTESAGASIHDILLANVFAQAEALASQDGDQVKAERHSGLARAARVFLGTARAN